MQRIKTTATIRDEKWKSNPMEQSNTLATVWILKGFQCFASIELIQWLKVFFIFDQNYLRSLLR
mgnify:CR=1 FL=1